MRKSAHALAQRFRTPGIAGWALILSALLAGSGQAASPENPGNCAARAYDGAMPVPAAGRADETLAHAKGDAILGAPSRFALIRAQQAGAAVHRAPTPASTAAPVDCTNSEAFLAPRPAVVTGALPGFAPRADSPDVFGSVAMAVSRTPFDANWNKVRAGGISAGPWSHMLQAARGRDRAEQLRLVNSWVNARIAFVDDIRQHGIADHWATPAQSLLRGRGDCEDYAIAKLGLLRSLGIPASDLYLVIARDLVRRADHAVLAVRLGGRLMVLDNQTDRILDAEAVHDYRPVMSYAADRSWTHGYRVRREMDTPLRTASLGGN